ncbi:S-methyl-5-thioribose-1-phosphate isomerase [Streptomyces iconiensis]|uniref:Methylthioribose-1-phosphate isomerase n=1 Tax=Streptomyces iconiensis TaxID=1384038 RepID=A0ABT6ZNC0_9ACTN|nr:S-methyl-5-thioribose-1-phosphate isomerase [Streptomyces iconiensis]MDJ1130538.1 S-methyl-5-thioribose-1-phosphate isomerase [Streptomyces iconiensis]
MSMSDAPRGTAAGGREARDTATPPVIGWQDGAVVVLDQTQLPQHVVALTLRTVDELIDAVRRLAVRGAPVLGAAGALGVALAARQAQLGGWSATFLGEQVERLRAARPTAVDLGVGVSAVLPALRQGPEAARVSALAYLARVVEASHRIGERGADFVAEACGTGPLTVQTHCNTGALACVEWGTALGVIRSLHARHLMSRVIVDETRPLLQGARLTCWELGRAGIDYRLVCDGAGPFVLAREQVDAVVVGADRIAANGDTANKIGTFGLALAARHAGIPFVVAAPETTLDGSLPDGSAIPVESRSEDEVTHAGGRRVAPDDARALNYAFDITPAGLISAIVTDRRLITSPAGPSAW